MKKLLLFIITVGIVTNASSQKVINPLNADSLATGNYKDLLTSFFQLAFDKITGPDKEIKFSSNPFAVMAKLDTSLFQSQQYYDKRHLRDLNFSFSLKLDSAYKFNGFTSSIKYAIVNKRDETVSRLFLDDVAKKPEVQELFSINNDLEAFIATFASNRERQAALRASKDKFFTGEINFKDLDAELKTKITTLIKDKKLKNVEKLIGVDDEFNMIKTTDKIYDDMKEHFNNKLLWTVGISDTTYKDQFAFSNVVLSTEILKGIDDMKTKDIELNIKSAVQFLDDSLISGRDLKRSVFSIEPGINFILKTKNLKSFFEFKLSGSYYHTFSSLYNGEERDINTLNATLRLRVLDDIWIPLEIKWDRKNGNVLGFLNVRANFTTLGKLAREVAKL